MATDSYHAYLALFGILLLATIARSQDMGFEDNIKGLIAKRKNLEYVKQLVDDMDNQLNRLHKSACMLHMPGLDCPGRLSDRVQALLVPSRKRSFHPQPLYSCDFKVGNPEGCLGKLIEGDNKDNTHWDDPDGPGKK